MTNSTLKVANELNRLLNSHGELKDYLQHELGAAKAGQMPDMHFILDYAHRLNVITPKMMVPLLEEYSELAKVQREELEEALKAL